MPKKMVEQITKKKITEFWEKFNEIENIQKI